MKLLEIVMIALIALLPSLGWSVEEHLPEPDMLEFLGRFETSGGKPVDPLLFEETGEHDKKKIRPVASKGDRKRKKHPGKKEQKDPDNEK
jgi:hypothetical protein